MMHNRTRGFTLIELLVVVAIIGILAAIAVQNFMNAQVRAKIAVAQADMRNICQQLQILRLENDSLYAGDGARLAGSNGLMWLLSYVAMHANLDGHCYSYMIITTPVAYLSSIDQARDPFADMLIDVEGETYRSRDRGVGCFGVFSDFNQGRFLLKSVGPDHILEFQELSSGLQDSMFYDASNGLYSYGDTLWLNANLKKNSQFVFD